MRVAFLTLGCKVNYYETEKMMSDFRQHGFEVTGFGEKADVYIVNTCTVTNIADRKSRKMLHRARKLNRDGVVAAVGCYVESGGEALLNDGAVDVAFSNRDKKSMAEKVLSYLRETGRLQKMERPENRCVSEKETELSRTRKYIKIQDGCNQFCTYCMIPYVRGRGVLKSRAEEEILQEIQDVADSGCKEVVVTGIHLSSYGVDRTEEKQFVKLKGQPLVEILKKIDGIDGIRRIRLGSLEPRIICPEFMEGLKQVKKLCPHFHLSLQSGCDSTLRRMNRHYTTEEYRQRCEMLRSYYEHPAITTDIIVGFPGETEDDFAATCRFVKEIRFADIHVFPYSKRDGTKAASMPDQVPPEKKHERSDKLLRDAEILRQEYLNWFVGREERVLFEEVREFEGESFLTGHNERYVMIKVPVKQAETNGFYENEIGAVKIQRINLC